MSCLVRGITGMKQVSFSKSMVHGLYQINLFRQRKMQSTKTQIRSETIAMDNDLFVCFRLFIIATCYPSERLPLPPPPEDGYLLQVTKIQDETTESPACFFNVLGV